MLLLLLLRLKLLLQEYAPMCKMLIEPPYEFAPHELPPLVEVKVLESTEVTFCTRTSMPLAFVDPHVLVLVNPVLF